MSALPTPVDGVEEVARAYEKLFQSGDRAAFDRAFAPDGAYLTLPRDPSAPLAVRSFADAYAGWASEPDPLARVGIIEISFPSEKMAMMRLWLHHRGRRYLDQLSLYRFGPEWKIVAKQSQVARD